MKKAKDLLAKWQGLMPEHAPVRGVLPDIIKKYTGAEVIPANITTRHGIAFIKASPLVKAEIFLKKQRILTTLSQEMGAKAPRDIK